MRAGTLRWFCVPMLPRTTCTLGCGAHVRLYIRLAVDRSPRYVQSMVHSASALARCAQLYAHIGASAVGRVTDVRGEVPLTIGIFAC